MSSLLKIPTPQASERPCLTAHRQGQALVGDHAVAASSASVKNTAIPTIDTLATQQFRQFSLDDTPTRLHVEHLHKGAQLGCGKTSKVRLVRSLSGTREFALKECSDWHALKREHDLQKLIQSPYVLSSYKCERSHLGSGFMTMPLLAGGTLKEKIATGLTFEKTSRYFKHLVLGLSHMHSQHIAHRDLKPQNVMFDSTHDRAIIIDLGLSQLTADHQVRDSRGTPDYIPLEVHMLQGKPYDAMRADVYNLGAVVYEMLFGVVPFTDSNELALAYRLLKRSKAEPDALSFKDKPVLSESQKKLLQRMLHSEPAMRPTLREILEDAWMVGTGES